MSSVHSKSSMLDIASDLIELASNYADQVLRSSSKSPPPEHVDSEKSNPRIPVGPPSMGRRLETPTLRYTARILVSVIVTLHCCIVDDNGSSCSCLSNCFFGFECPGLDNDTTGP